VNSRETELAGTLDVLQLGHSEIEVPTGVVVV